MLQRLSKVGRVWNNPKHDAPRREIRFLELENKSLIERIVRDCRPGKGAAIHVAFSKVKPNMQADPAVLATADFLLFGREVAVAWMESTQKELISAQVPEGFHYNERPAYQFFGRQLFGILSTASNLFWQLNQSIGESNSASEELIAMRLRFFDMQVAEAAKRLCIGFSPVMRALS